MMFALPPIQAPKYPTVPLADAKNTVEHPTGPEWQLQLTEGTYTLRDDFLLGMIPPHPSDIPNPNPNVLDPKPKPPESGVKACLAILAPRRSHARLRRVTTSGNNPTTLPPSISEEAEGPNGFSSMSANTKSRFGEKNPALAVIPTKASKDPLNRRKPKNHVAKSNSSFLSRAIIHEHLHKKLNERNPEGAFGFVNINRAMQWFDLSATNKTDPLVKLLFTKAHALCTDFNNYSKTALHLDVVIGFNTSDLMWWEPVSCRYTRLNKNGIINPTPVSDVRWLPGSENLFIASHYDGSLIVYDKEKEDSSFASEQTPPPQGFSNRPPYVLTRKSVTSQNQKLNPVAAYKLSNSRINAFAFSPSGTHIAAVSEDGTLRILDFLGEQITDVFPSYYGALTCVAWSPDSVYIATGGQDDLITIWSVADRMLVARCVGHHSWVSAVEFDRWRCDERSYRFGSVGQDGRLCLWDFNIGMLRRPRVGSMRPSVSSSYPLGAGGSRNASSTTLSKLNPASQNSERSRRLETVSTAEDEEKDGMNDGASLGDDVMHEVVPRAQVAMLPPVMSKIIDDHALVGMTFEDDSIVTTCKRGHIRTWDRPKEDAAEVLNPFKP